MAKLDDTKNLLALYLHHVSELGVSNAFHQWACLSLIAACVANRVCVEVIRGSPLYPNLYVFLIGPSGAGKGVAIDQAMKFLKDYDRRERVNVYSASKVTAEYLITHLAVRGKQGKGSTVYLSTPEMSLSVGRGDRADVFIRTMTELFTGRDYAMSEGTVTRGEHSLRDYCINWIAGTTMEWLNDSIRRQDIAGGFFARIIPALGEPMQRRIPGYPYDADEVMGYLYDRFEMLSRLEGVFALTDEARALHEYWIVERPERSDPLLAPSWSRGPEMVLKLAMILALTDEDAEQLVIRRSHITAAQRLVTESHKALPRLIDEASESDETQGLTVVREIIQRYEVIQHKHLVAYALRRGISPPRLRVIVDGLAQAGFILRAVGPAGQVYAWIKKRRG